MQAIINLVLLVDQVLLTIMCCFEGVGYHLTIVKTPTCDVKNLLAAVKYEIPMTQLVSDEAKEVMFLLPSNQATKFEGLFEVLETGGKTLGIENFGVSVTTMEDVFIRLIYVYYILIVLILI